MSGRSDDPADDRLERHWRAYERLYRRLVREAVRRTLYRYGVVWSSEEIEDAVSEILVRLAAEEFAALERFRGEGSFEGYLYRIACNWVIDRLRSAAERARGRSVDVTETPLADERTPSPLAELLWRERVAQLRAALAELSEEDRTLVLLLVEQELGAQEVAQLLGISVGAVYTRKHRILKRLYRAVQDRDSEDVKVEEDGHA